MRIGFVTCVQLGLSCMQAIYEVGGRLSFAMTLRDDLAVAKSGRVYLDDFCATHDIPLQKVGNVNDANALAGLHAMDLDWLFIVGWSQIAKGAVLETPRRGVLGMHPTMLPVGRGRAPVPWAILLGLESTGVTLFKLDAGVDTGPIVAQQSIPIHPRETATTLYQKANDAHILLLRNNWTKLVADELRPQPQDESRSSVWRARKPEDGRLHADMDVHTADRLIRAVTYPYPGAFIEAAAGRTRVWSSGAPFEDLGGQSKPEDVLRLHFRDGWLDATQWQIETQ